MSSNPLAVYRSAVQRALQQGNATEHTHRPALKALVEGLKAGVTATNEPRRVACGAPDFVVSVRKKHGALTVGHIEAKDVGLPLDAVEKGEQLKRYLPALENLLLTDYLEFRWYVNGSRRAAARLATPNAAGKLVPEKGGPDSSGVEQLLRDFLAREPEPVVSPRELAERMARLTRMTRAVIAGAFAAGEASGTLQGLRQAFSEVLLPDLTEEQFADMFAQTLAYGLFAARVNHEPAAARFSRRHAGAEIPKTNPFLRQLFHTVTGPDLDSEPFAVFVDDLADLLADADMEQVLSHFGKRGAREDPVVHFYETFLAAYDPALRERRGVYYTPEPVVSYIVRSVDHLLRERFGLAGGLADLSTTTYTLPGEDGKERQEEGPRVLILDPACGTGTFLYSVVDHIRGQFMREGNAGMWSGFVREQLLPRLFGFELLMAPYAVAHLKLGMQLAAKDLPEESRDAWAYDFAAEDRLRVYLTNTLEEAAKRSRLLMGQYISDEANAAAEVKSSLPIMVVLGNPPYSKRSANKGATLGELVRDYYQVDGKPLGERNPKWLQDDYVKFIRFGEWRIENTGAGILAFITNHGYLDNPTFRGMRQRLARTFTDIYLLTRIIHHVPETGALCSRPAP